VTVTPARSYTRIAIAIVIAAVVIGAGIVASSYLGPVTTVTNTSTATTTLTSTMVTIETSLTQPCDVQVWNTSSPTKDTNIPVLLMRPESTAFICVTYQSAWADNSSQYNASQSPFIVNDTYQFNLSIFKVHCIENPTTDDCIATVSDSFEISALPGSIRPSATTDYVTVVYLVDSSSNSTGFYDGSAPFEYCYALPIAVGYAASQVNASDFAPRDAHSCAAVPFTPSSVSVGGMNVTNVAF
jgi:hypothetical protein